MDWLLLLLATLMTQPVSGPPPDWATALHGFDLVRSQAFERDDPVLLRAVYPESSPLLRADRQTMADYRARGLRVVDMRMRIESMRVLRADDGRVRLDVVDRLVAARVRLPDGTVRRLPRDQPTRRTIEVSRTARGWRITAVVAPLP